MSDNIISEDGKQYKLVDENKVPSNLTVVPTNRKTQQLEGARLKRLADLPNPPKEMNVVSVILSYVLFGLDNEDIATAVNVTVNQVELIKSSDAYKTMYETAVDTIRENDLDNIRSMFVKNSKAAARTVNNLMYSDEDMIKLKAAQDILDRAGHRPKDVTEHIHSLEGGLTIEYIKKKDKEDLPIIDI